MQVEQRPVVVITGANSGVGLALTRRLLCAHLPSVPYPSKVEGPEELEFQNWVWRLRRRLGTGIAATVATHVRCWLDAACSVLPPWWQPTMAGSLRSCVWHNSIESNIVIVMACRSIAKAEAARALLVRECVPQSPTLGFRSLVTMELDLARPSSVFAFCDEFSRKFNRLDVLVANAGYYPVDHVDYMASVTQLVSNPRLVFETGGECIVQRVGELTTDGQAGLVFTSNVLSHYMLVRELGPLLTAQPNGRVVWTASTSGRPEFFDPADAQCLRGAHPYESSKRATDLLSHALATAGSSKSHVPSFLASPGNVLTNMINSAVSSWVLFFVFLIGRLVYGVRDNNIDPLRGAESLFQLVEAGISQSSALSSANPSAVKHHSETLRCGITRSRALPLDNMDASQAVALQTKCETLYKKYSKAHRSSLVKSK